MSNITLLQNEIDGFVVINDKVCKATIVGVTSDDKMVAIIDDGISIEVRNVKEAFRDEEVAQLTLKNVLSDRVLLKEFNARQAERESVEPGRIGRLRTKAAG